MLLNAADGNSLEQQLAAETESFASSALTKDFEAGVAAFVEKKPAAFTRPVKENRCITATVTDYS